MWSAEDINDRGQIVGTGYYRLASSGLSSRYGFLLTPVAPAQGAER
jgi:hypothetical protein